MNRSLKPETDQRGCSFDHTRRPVPFRRRQLLLSSSRPSFSACVIASITQRASASRNAARHVVQSGGRAIQGPHTTPVQNSHTTRTQPARNPHRRAVIRSGVMKSGASGSFGAHLKALREAAGFTQEELATVAGLSVHTVSALERGERRRPHVDTVRALSAALDLSDARRDALLASGRGAAHAAVFDDRSGGSLPLALTALLGRGADLEVPRAWFAGSAFRLVLLTGPGGAG